MDGSLRAYVIGEDGQEHTIQLAIEEWWISDYNSYIYQQPASMFVVALEDSLLLEISHADETKLKAANHQFETFFRMLAERSVALCSDGSSLISPNLQWSVTSHSWNVMQHCPAVSTSMLSPLSRYDK